MIVKSLSKAGHLYLTPMFHIQFLIMPLSADYKIIKMHIIVFTLYTAEPPHDGQCVGM